MPAALRYLVAALLAGAIWMAVGAGGLESRALFVFASLTLATFLALEAWFASRRPSDPMFSPPVLASLWTFFLPYAATNYVYLTPQVRSNSVEVFNPGMDWLTRTVALALLGAAAMWFGYHSSSATQLARRVSWRLRAQHLLRTRFDSLRWSVVALCVLVAVGARLIAFRLGIYGYNSDKESLAATESFRQYLTMADGLGQLALAAVALHRFAKPDGFGRWALPLLLANEIVWGFLGGFKSGVVMPLVVVVVAGAVARGRIPRAYVLAAVPAVALAYAVIEPYRLARYNTPDFDARSVTYVAGTLVSAAARDRDDLGPARSQSEGVHTSVIARMTLTGIGAVALRYSNVVGLDDDDPDFLRSLVVSPVAALIPRFLWPDKPKASVGGWAYQTMLGRRGNTAVGIGPVSYLYLAGGALAVAIGFFVLGWVQRFTTSAFFSADAGGLIVFVGLLSLLAQVDTDFSTLITTYVRYLPLLLGVQFLMFAR